jgi:proline iminopeptidase
MNGIMICAFCLASISYSAQAQTPTTVKHPPGDYVTVNGAKLWYESEGQGEPLILISGGPGDSHGIFHPFFSRLAARHRVVYFDAFGVGKSDRGKSRKEYSFARDVEDMEGLRKGLGLSKIDILGQSYGGMVAQAYALKYPESVRRLILADTFYSGKMWQTNNDNCNYEIRNQFPEVWERLQKMRARGLRSSAPEHQREYYGVPLGLFYFHDASKAKLLPKTDSNQDVYYAIAGDDADFTIGGDIAGLDFRTDLHALKMPILVLAGRFDRVSIPRYALEYKRYAPQARFVVMEHSGHFSFIEEPDETQSALREFLEK